MKQMFTLVLLIAALGPTYVKAQDTVNGNPLRSKTFEEPVDPNSYRDMEAFLKSTLAIKDANVHFKLFGIKQDAFGNSHERYAQVYLDIPVENHLYIIHKNRDKKIYMVNGEYDSIPATVDLKPGIDFSSALSRTIAAKKIKSHRLLSSEKRSFSRPDQFGDNAVEQVIWKNKKNEFRLAYRVKMETDQPATSGINYIDAKTGEHLFCQTLICSINTPANVPTMYSGNQDITTDSYGGGYRLYESNVNGASYISTKNWNRNPVDPGYFQYATEWVDGDNNWTLAEYANGNYDIAALDAHYAAERCAAYVKGLFGRNSIDNNGLGVNVYVHVGYNQENAFWEGNYNALLIGDGASGSSPLTTLDIIGHEYGHGLTQYMVSGGITYAGESGAINESISDMWGAAIEASTNTGKNPWFMGDDRSTTVGRRMNDPWQTSPAPNYPAQPKYYQGLYWHPTNTTDDNGGVHTNSGVGNFWFYLVANGGSGTNEVGYSYNVPGISIDQATRIVYQAVDNYAIPGILYSDLRTYTNQAAVDIFGANSCQQIAVQNAWKAVGIGNEYNMNLLIQGGSRICGPTTFSISPNGPIVSSWTITPAVATLVPSGNSVLATGIADGPATLTANYNGCLSGSSSKAVTIGGGGNKVNGPSPVSPGGAYIYTFDKTPAGGTFSSWSVPVGWTLDTWSIATATVQAGAIGQNGDIIAYYNNCGKTYAAFKNVIVTSGGGVGTRIANSEELQGLQISPNPTTDVLTFSAPVSADDLAEVSDMTGKVLKQVKLKGNKRETINIASLPTGSYVLRVVNRKTRTAYSSIFVKN